MGPTTSRSLVRLLQIASPALPVGAYSYSQGLEAAIEARIVYDAASAHRWIGEMLEHLMAPMEAPLVALLRTAWQCRDLPRVNALNDLFLASRETAELRAESVQMGYSLARLLIELDPSGRRGSPASATAPEHGNDRERGSTLDDLRALAEPAFPVAFACAAECWGIDPHDALVGYLWSWLENQVMAALKAVPLGQTDGQRMLLQLAAGLDAIATRAMQGSEDDLENYAPHLAILSSQHATQYSRLFRS